jgi:hypothetical protein
MNISCLFTYLSFLKPTNPSICKILFFFLTYFSPVASIGLTTRIIDAHHVTHFRAKKQFADYKTYQTKFTTAGVHSNASVCYVLLLLLSLNSCCINMHFPVKSIFQFILFSFKFITCLKINPESFGQSKILR